MEVKEEKAKPYDPFEPYREMRDAYLDAMSKTMLETVNSEAYAKATGALLDWSLTATGAFREALDRSMLQALQQLSLPSRHDIVALAERLTNLELRLDDMDAKLDRVLKLLSETRSNAPAEQAGNSERLAGETGSEPPPG